MNSSPKYPKENGSRYLFFEHHGVPCRIQVLREMCLFVQGAGHLCLWLTGID